MIIYYRKIIEIVIIFILLPVSVIIIKDRFPLLLLLFVYGLIIFFILKKDKTFDKNILKKIKTNRSELIRIFSIFVISSVLMIITILITDKQKAFFLVKNNPGLLLLICIFYPIFSVVPQTLAYRVLFFHRYASVFKTETARIVVSAAFFSFAHILYKNYLVLILTFFAGLIFSYTYSRNKSFLLSFAEHSVYGIALFASGLGYFFVSAFVE